LRDVGAARGRARAAYVVAAFREAVSAPPEGGADPGIDVLARRASACGKDLLVDTLHRGLDWLYRAEESFHR